VDLAIFILTNVLIFASIFLGILAVFRFPVEVEPPLHRRIALALGMGRRETVFESPFLAPIMSLMLTISRRFGLRGIRQRIERDLDAAGNPNGYSVEEYLAICLGCAALVLVMSAVVILMLTGVPNPILPAVLGVLGFFIPIVTLRGAAKARTQRISKQLPYTLDLVAIMMAAGSTFPEAVETIIRDAPDDDLNQELKIVQSEIEFGTTRATALANLAERIPLEALRSVVGAINQAELLGTPLSLILKNQSTTLRNHRSVRAEKLSASAGLRILIPSMLILIAIVLTVFGPLIVRYISTGSLY
jgi:tight adherence protein C